MSHSVKDKSIKAVTWTAQVQVLSQITGFVTGILLARMLTPDDFGLVAAVMIITAISLLLADLGLTEAIIQSKELTQDHFSTSYFFVTLVGFILMFGVQYFSENIALFFARPEISDICVLLSITFAFNSMSFMPKALLQKELKFKEISLIEFTSLLVGAIVGISSAMNDFGFYSLAFQLMAQAFINTLLFNIYSPMKPNAIFRPHLLRQMMRFSLYVFGTKSVRQVALQMDKFLLGKYIDTATLGLYTRSFQIMLFPLNTVSRSIGNVMFPALSKIQGDKPRVRSIYLRAIAIISLITTPMMIGMLVVSPYFVEAVLGEQWLGMVPILRVFSIIGVFTAVATITGSVYLSMGQAKLQFKVNLVNQPILILSLMIGIRFGLQGILVAYLFSNIVAVFITWHTAGKLIDCTIKVILESLLPLLLTSSVMGIVVLAADYVFGQGFTPFAKLFMLTLTGIGVYIFLLEVCRIRAYLDLKKILFERIKA